VTEPAVAAVMQKPMQWVQRSDPAHARDRVRGVVCDQHVPAHHHRRASAKNWAILNPDKMLPVVAAPLVAFTYILYPGSGF